jgi:hypothetical protein
MDKLLIGPLPPPIGGVSNHLIRFAQKNSIPVFREKSKYSYHDFCYILKLRNKEIYSHSISWKILAFLFIKRIFLNHKCNYYLINHNFQAIYTIERSVKGLIHFFLIQRYVKNCKVIYVVNPDLIDKMKALYGTLNYKVFDPFEPPDENKEDEIWDSYGEDILKFISEHEVLISSGAWQLSFHNGEDLYGFDLLIKMMAELKQYKNKVGLIFFIGNPNYNEQYIQKCNDLIDELAIRDDIFILSGQKEMWPIIKRSNIFIRATNTDGDPLSIKEAVYFGTKVIASNCCTRDQHASIFQSRDLKSLLNSIRLNIELN